MELKNEQYYIVRANRAGVFFGKIKEKTDKSVTMTEVRKLFYWNGACAVEEIALHGVKRPSDCKFTVTIEEMEIADPIQIIPCTKDAVKSIKDVIVWQF